MLVLSSFVSAEILIELSNSGNHAVLNRSAQLGQEIIMTNNTKQKINISIREGVAAETSKVSLYVQIFNASSIPTAANEWDNYHPNCSTNLTNANSVNGTWWNVSMPVGCTLTNDTYWVYLNVSSATGNYYAMHTKVNQYTGKLNKSLANGTSYYIPADMALMVFGETKEYISNCSNTTVKSINFSSQYFNGTPVIADTEFYIQYNYTSGVYSNYTLTTNTNHTEFCIFDDTKKYTADFWIDYTVGSTTYNYFTDDLILDNNWQEIILYSQESTTTAIQFRVSDQLGDDPIAGALIKILRFDVGNGVYRTTEVLRTDSEGFAIGNIVPVTEWYKFNIEVNGVTRLQTEPEKFTSGTTTREFRIDVDTNWYDHYDTANNIEYNLSFNEATNNFKFAFNDPSGSMTTGCLKVEKLNSTGTYLIADNCTTSTSAIVLVNVAPVGTNMTGRHYKAAARINLNPPLTLDIKEKIFARAQSIFNLGSKGKSIGIMVTFMLSLTLGFIGIWSIPVAVILMIIGVVFSILTGFYILSTGSLITLIVLAIIIIWRQSKR